MAYIICNVPFVPCQKHAFVICEDCGASCCADHAEVCYKCGRVYCIDGIRQSHSGDCCFGDHSHDNMPAAIELELARERNVA